MSTEKLLRFEGFTLDLDRLCLLGASGRVDLRRQSFDVLRYLVENAGRVISKQEIINAVWPNVTVSDDSLTQCISDVRRALGDSMQRIIKTIARRGYLIDVPVSAGEPSTRVIDGSTEQATKTGAAPAVPDRPSIAVLPFENLSGDPEQEYFADGIVEEITTALSRMRWLFVVARNTSFTFKGRSVDVQKIGRDLGVRYVLEGSVRKSGNQLRVTGQLIDASNGTHIWAHRFDGALADIFDFQDQVTASVVGAIAPRLEQVEIERAKRKPTKSLDAYDHFLRGMASIYVGTKEANDEALRRFRRAIELDPDFAAAYGLAAYCFLWRKMNGWMVDSAQEVIEAEQLARKSIELGKDDAVALSRGGHILAYIVGDVDGGADFIDRARSLNPNLAAAWYASGWTRIYRGEHDTAVEHLTHAMRLSPLDPEIAQTYAGLAIANVLSDRYDEASSWAQKAMREKPTYLTAIRVAAVSNALAGRLEQAQRAVSALRKLDPALRISNLKARLPFRPKDVTLYAEGLRKAGLPE